jgi:hypothetical protein
LVVGGGGGGWGGGGGGGGGAGGVSHPLIYVLGTVDGRANWCKGAISSLQGCSCGVRLLNTSRQTHTATHLSWCGNRALNVVSVCMGGPGGGGGATAVLQGHGGCCL